MEQASNNSGDLGLNWLDRYLNGHIATGVFGGQITFIVVISEIADPAASRVGPTSTFLFGKDTVRLFVALSWLLFMMELGIAALGKVLLMDDRIKHAMKNYFERKGRAMGYVYSVFSFVMNGLPLVAFLFLALAVTAYVPVVGLIGVGMISLFTFLVFVLWAMIET
jgi:hypothetical protein